MPYLFWNDHGRRLISVGSQSGDYFRRHHLGRGAACGDFDQNGAPDLIVTHTNEPVSILRNETPVGNWLSVRLIGTVSPRSPIGATVTLRCQDRTQIGVMKGGGSYLSTSEATIHFGLGDQEFVDSLEVEWPSGENSVLTHVSSQQRLQIIEAKVEN